jgi:PAS domain S-box-containing protein
MAKRWIDVPGMGYLLAVAGVGIVALIPSALEPYLGYIAAHILFYLPIAIAAYLGGRGPGLLALLLGAVTATFWFLPPRGRFLVNATEDLILLALFLVTGFLAVWLAAWARTARQKALRQMLRVRQTLESMSDGYVLLGFDWNVLDMNSQAKRVLESSGSELLGRNVWESLPWVRDTRFGEFTRRAMKERVPVRFEEFLPHLGKWLEESLYPCEEGVAIFFRDVTQRKHSEAGLRLLFDVSTRLLKVERMEETLHGILDSVADHLGLGLYLNYLVTEDGRRLRLNAFRGLDEATARTAEYLEFGQCPFGIMAGDRCRVILHHVQSSQNPEVAPIRESGLRAYACYHLLDDRLRGLVAFGAYDRDYFTDEELATMHSVADQASLALAKQHLATELEQRAAALQNVNKAKDHFLATLSHELRTPLTPILASVSLLQSERRLDSEIRHSLDVIRRNVELEARLIDDLLDITRIARGKVELHKRTVLLCEVLMEAVDVCQPDIEARRLHSDVAVEPGVSSWVEGDPARLQQVFWNLLKNAIKFTPPGGRLNVRCYQNNGQAVAAVEDSGEGIEPEALGRIFNAFEQADRSTTRQFGGLGLGLAISKTLVEMHGGTIQAFSEGRGKGATFEVRLPLAPAPAAPPCAAPVQVTTETLERHLEVLLVEDHGDTARVLARILTRRGYRVETAGDVAAALEVASHRRFDLLISDLGLPDRSGLELISELRLRGQTLPAIALSGYGQEEDVKRSREAGFTVHMIKPVNFDQFYNAIAAVTR